MEAADPRQNTPAAREFPLRVGAIDVGSNALRFLAVEFLAPFRKNELQRLRVPVRLGRSAFRSGKLSAEDIDGALAGLVSFRQNLQSLGILAYRAVATSAMRESDNAGELMQRARDEADIEIEIISGSEEARLVWMAVAERFPMKGRWLLVDLGGGSLEVSALGDQGVEWTESHTMGTVRMLEELGGTRPATKPLPGRLVAEYVNTLRLPLAGKEAFEGLVATGGNIEALADLVGSPADATGVRRLPLAALRETHERIGKLSYAQRIEQLGMREDRADVIVPAGFLYLRIAEIAGVDEIVVPDVGVKDGLILDLVEDLTTHRVHTDRQASGVWGAAVALGRHYRFDEAHGLHVARIALSLFEQLEALHGLGEADRRILIGASLLHDIGQFISYRKHHKHSQYLILNGELPVFTPGEIPLVALVARYHRGAEPRDDHEIWCDLAPVDQARVVRLAALLRVADSLDREHLQRVKSIGATIGPESVKLAIDPQGDLLLERWALERKGGLFEKTFARRLRVDSREAAHDAA